MAKKIIRRRKARKPAKPEVYDVNGQQLSAAQWELFQENLRERTKGIVRPAEHKAQDSFGPLFRRTATAGAAIQLLSNFPFYEDDEKLIGLGNAVIRHCAEELWAVVSELNSMHEGIAKQIAPEVRT